MILTKLVQHIGHIVPVGVIGHIVPVGVMKF